MSHSRLIEPYGGELVDLLVSAEKVHARLSYANTLPSIRISQRVECDLELLAVGAFSPLDRFMGSADLQTVMDSMRLTSGHLFPIPIVLPVDEDDGVAVGMEIALRSTNNHALAIMRVEEMYAWDSAEMAVKVFGKNDTLHPLVAEMQRWGNHLISGPLEVIQLPPHYDFQDIRLTPRQTRERLAQMGQSNIVAFQTRNPLHRVHEELTKRAADTINGALLLHPVVGMTKPGDVDHYTRVRTYQALINNYYEPNRVLLALIPLAMRMAGPREALWHAIIRRNYGANHIIIGRDHAGPGKGSDGKPFYGPYDAQDVVMQHSDEIGVTMVPFRMLVYLPDEGRYEEIDQVPSATKRASISGTQVREEYLAQGRKLPTWFTRPEVAEILADSYPPSFRRGVCIWITGLSSSGKTTIANILTVLLQAHGRQVSLLEGNVVRAEINAELGFSAEDRDTNNLRMAYFASEVVRHGGIAICTAISPYRSTRNAIRSQFNEESFIEVFADAPIEVCEARDSKGLYARARRGELLQFTGITDPYEPPQNPEIHLYTAHNIPSLNAQIILNYLSKHGFVR